jgi:hypothetical protein
MSSSKRPIYVVAHRINHPDEIFPALQLGANAIECDLRYDGYEKEWFVEHGGITDIFEQREPLELWLATAAKAAKKFGDKFALILFDIKTCDIDLALAMVTLHQKSRAVLPNDLNLVFSTASFDDREGFSQLLSHLTEFDGISFDGNESPNTISGFSKRKTKNLWYGAGITIMMPGEIYQDMVDKAGKLRDAGCGIKKTFIYTLASGESIREALEERHVDAVLVNEGTIRDAVHIACRKERLAQRSDAAFAVYNPDG